jgi:hypothetical protein
LILGWYYVAAPHKVTFRAAAHIQSIRGGAAYMMRDPLLLTYEHQDNAEKARHT